MVDAALDIFFLPDFRSLLMHIHFFQTPVLGCDNLPHCLFVNLGIVSQINRKYVLILRKGGGASREQLKRILLF